MKQLYILCLSMVIALVACDSPLEHDIGLDNGDYMIKPVLNATLSGSDAIKVHLSQSKAILNGDPFSPIENALIEVYNNNQSIVLQHDGLGYYRSDERIQAGQTYQIKATTAQGTVSASQYIPMELKFEKLAYEDSVQYESEEVVLSKIEIEINDRASEENYYDLLIYQKPVKDTIEPLRYRANPLDPSSTTQDILYGNRDVFQENGNDYVTRSLFSDVSFDGKNLKLSLWVKTAFPDLPVHVHLKSISKDYFNYIEQVITSSGTLDDPFTEPVTIQTNIEGGLGVFGGYSLALDSLNR